MIDSISTWPPHWAVTFAIGTAFIATAWILTSRQVHARYRRSHSLSEAVFASGMELTPEAFAVSGQDASLLVSGNRLAVLDLDEPRLIRTYSLLEVEALNIYDDQDHDAIDFHLALRGGARSRRIHTGSIQEFCWLFAYLQKADKNIHFIAE